MFPRQVGDAHIRRKRLSNEPRLDRVVVSAALRLAGDHLEPPRRWTYRCTVRCQIKAPTITERIIRLPKLGADRHRGPRKRLPWASILRQNTFGFESRSLKRQSF